MMTFHALEERAFTARAYREVRQYRPDVPASTALAYLRDPAGCLNIDQYTCRHVWNMTAGEADECGGNIRCCLCDLDGDA